MIFSLSLQIGIAWLLILLFVVYTVLFGAVFTGGPRKNGGGKKFGLPSQRFYYNSLLVLLLLIAALVYGPMLALPSLRILGAGLVTFCIFALLQIARGLRWEKDPSQIRSDEGYDLSGKFGFLLFAAITCSLGLLTIAALIGAA